MLQFYPASEFPTALVVKLPAESEGKPETSVIGGAAANSDDALASAAFRCRSQHDSDPACVQVKRVVLTARQLREADDPSGLDNCGCLVGVPPPTG